MLTSDHSDSIGGKLPEETEVTTGKNSSGKLESSQKISSGGITKQETYLVREFELTGISLVRSPERHCTLEVLPTPTSQSKAEASLRGGIVQQSKQLILKALRSISQLIA